MIGRSTTDINFESKDVIRFNFWFLLAKQTSSGMGCRGEGLTDVYWRHLFGDVHAGFWFTVVFVSNSCERRYLASDTMMVGLVQLQSLVTLGYIEIRLSL